MSSSREISDFRRRAVVASPILLVIVSVNALLLVYEILRANDPDTFSVKLLGVPTAAALLAGTAAFVSFRHGAQVTTAPLMRYVSRWVSSPERSLTTGADKFWQVRVRNVGRGSAVLDEVSWTLGRTKSAQASLRSIDDIQAQLSSLDLMDARDYWIANYSAGTAFAADEERCYFECTDRFIEVVGTFEAVFVYTSLHGERYEKRVSLVPHPGASAVVLDAARDGTKA